MTSAAPAGMLRADGEATLLFVRLTPRGGRDAIDGIETLSDGRAVLAVRVRAVPENGRANAALEKLLAESLGYPARLVQVIARVRPRASRRSALMGRIRIYGKAGAPGRGAAGLRSDQGRAAQTLRCGRVFANGPHCSVFTTSLCHDTRTRLGKPDAAHLSGRAPAFASSADLQAHDHDGDVGSASCHRCGPVLWHAPRGGHACGAGRGKDAYGTVQAIMVRGSASSCSSVTAGRSSTTCSAACAISSGIRARCSSARRG